MTLLADAFPTYDQIGRREDLMGVIYNIDPMDCPFMSSVDTGTCSGTKHEWQIDTLDTPAFNKQLEGDNIATWTAATPTTRAFNICQISYKLGAVTGTAEVVDKAGRGSEVSYQAAKLAKSLKRDVEYTVSRNQAIVSPGTSTTARALASYEDWIFSTNASRETTGGTPGADATGASTYAPTTAPTDSTTTRPLLESHLKSVLRSIADNGGNPTHILAGSFNKQAISAFSGNSTRFDQGEDSVLNAAIDYYVSDFGRHMALYSRFSRAKSVLCVDPSMWSIDYLRPFKRIPIAPTGDAIKIFMLAEYTLVARQPKSSGVVADLTTA